MCFHIMREIVATLQFKNFFVLFLKGRETKEGRFSSYWFTSHMPTIPSAGPGVTLGLPWGWQGCSHLPPRVCTSRKLELVLELVVEPGLEPGTVVS